MHFYQNLLPLTQLLVPPVAILELKKWGGPT